ncbi:MAG: hypothetical protein VX278_23245, partial [Myxococcota bacterium]|nr:hypothetical protein [Myxococcota bacterium]
MLLLLLSFALADIPAGENIENAILLDIPPTGFDSASEVIPALIPSEIPIPTTAGSSGSWCLTNYTYEL